MIVLGKHFGPLFGCLFLSSPKDPFPSQSLVWKRKYHIQKHLMLQSEPSPILFLTRPTIVHGRLSLWDNFLIHTAFSNVEKKIPPWKTKQNKTKQHIAYLFYILKTKWQASTHIIFNLFGYQRAFFKSMYRFHHAETIFKKESSQTFFRADEW